MTFKLFEFAVISNLPCLNMPSILYTCISICFALVINQIMLLISMLTAVRSQLCVLSEENLSQKLTTIEHMVGVTMAQWRAHQVNIADIE